MKFFTADNLGGLYVTESEPWLFKPDESRLSQIKAMPKADRRELLTKPSTKWNVYTAVRGLAKNVRVSASNPAHSVSALVCDYDMVSDVEQVMGYINQKPEAMRPNRIEISLSNKIRLHRFFARPILTAGTPFAEQLLETFVEKLDAATLLPGYDKNSTKPSEVWTNGGIWYDVRPEPLAWDYCLGVICSVAKKTSLFNKGEIPLEVIANEVQKRFPARWQGEFQLDAPGVRFWDETADCETGCQVKPDGMLCFTGPEPFMKWDMIFGRQWCEEQRILNLGRAAEGIYFDGKRYWERESDKWESVCREDIKLRLKGRGLSDRTPKGATVSDVERVLDHLQRQSRVEGAAPLVNYPPGITDLEGRRILNTANLRPVQPVPGAGKPDEDFPWIWKFLNGLFARPDLHPLDHFFSWLQRSYDAVLNYKRRMGQAIFLCGPRNNGKTLLTLRIIKPLLGNRSGNPIDYMVGQTTFNDDLLESVLLIIDDENPPENDVGRQRMLSRVKGMVVNPLQRHNAKFAERVMIPWVGRIVVLCNDDPGSVGMLQEVSQNTRDKMMYFRTQAYAGDFPGQDELEAIIATELPRLAHWLLNVYQPPSHVLSNDRMAIKSYFDPHVLDLANQQTFSSNLQELIQEWIRVSWSSDNTEWIGTPTALLTELQLCDPTATIAKSWNQQKINKSLTALAKQEGSGVFFANEKSREFKITKQAEPADIK